MKNINIIALAIVVLGTVLFPVVTQASTVIRSGDTISINEDQRIEGDFYVAANIINLSGQVADDISAVGGKVTINGTVEKDSLLVGANVNLHGPIGDDLRVVAGNVVIAEPVTGDVFVIARTVTILSTASVGGDVIIYGGDVVIEGSVGGNVVGKVDTLRLDGAVSGHVDVETDALVLGDKADVAGYIRYVSVNEVIRSQNAKTGDITRSDPEVSSREFDVKVIAIPFFIVLFAALVWYLIARQLLARIVARALMPGIRSVATGFSVFFGAPIAILILTLSLLGALVGVAGLFAYLLAIVLSIVSAAAVIGTFALQFYKKTEVPLSPFVIAFGVGLMLVCALVPVIGPVLLFVLFLITLGALVDLVIHP
jgi:hypothetical protein